MTFIVWGSEFVSFVLLASFATLIANFYSVYMVFIFIKITPHASEHQQPNQQSVCLRT